MSSQPGNAQQPATVDLVARRLHSLGPAYRLFYDSPLHIVAGNGVWLTDAAGKRYLDMYNNVPHVGHCHPHVVEAVRKQVGILNTHTRYLHENVVDYAERLLGRFPPGLDVAMFSCSGSEANELALRIAREVTGRAGVIVIEDAYHGTSQAAFDMSTEDNPPDRRPEYLVAVPAPDTYRGKYRDAKAAENYAGEVRRAIETLRSRGFDLAAFVIDTIASSSGVVAPPAGYLARVAEIVRDAGGLFIADEVQPGFGRTGRHFWGFETDRFVPDIVTLGKPMGNGHPMAATVARRDLVERFAQRFGYFNTFGGNPVSAAAGMAVLDVIESEDLQENARDVGSYLRDRLGDLSDSHAQIGDVRGHGLFLAIELVAEQQRPATELASRVVNGLKDAGVLTNTIGPHANVVKLRPPMVFSRADADFFLERIDRVLTDVRHRSER